MTEDRYRISGRGDDAFTCANCVFYQAFPGRPAADSYDGECRRSPKQLVSYEGEPDWQFPPVEGEEWCGEHKRRLDS